MGEKLESDQGDRIFSQFSMSLNITWSLVLSLQHEVLLLGPEGRRPVNMGFPAGSAFPDIPPLLAQRAFLRAPGCQLPKVHFPCLLFSRSCTSLVKAINSFHMMQ